MRKYLATLLLLLMSLGWVPSASGRLLSDPEKQSGRCAPELEGVLVSASSGVLLNASFEGTLIRRAPDGQTAPAVYASIAIASFPCPRGRPHVLQLDKEGHFEELYDVETDTHEYCIHGNVEVESHIIPIRLRISSPGCDDAEVMFSGTEKHYVVELACSTAVASDNSFGDDREAARPSGAEIVLSDDGLVVNGGSVTLPVDVSVLESLLGMASDVVAAAEDQYSNVVYEWEARGVYGFARPSGSEVHSLGFVLAGDHNSRHWCNPGTVVVTINGVGISAGAGSSRYRSAGFAKDGSAWRLHIKGFYASLLSVGEPPIYYELQVGVE